MSGSAPLPTPPTVVGERQIDCIVAAAGGALLVRLTLGVEIFERASQRAFAEEKKRFAFFVNCDGVGTRN